MIILLLSVRVEVRNSNGVGKVLTMCTTVSLHSGAKRELPVFELVHAPPVLESLWKIGACKRIISNIFLSPDFSVLPSTSVGKRGPGEVPTRAPSVVPVRDKGG